MKNENSELGSKTDSILPADRGMGGNEETANTVTNRTGDNQTNEPVDSSGNSGSASGATTKPAEGIFAAIIERATGDKLACNCKPAGMGGAHKATCPRRTGVASTHFNKPLVPAGNAPATMAPNPAGIVEPVTPRNYSFYGRLGETLIRARSRVKQHNLTKKFEPVIGETEAKALADELGIEEKDIEDLKAAMEELARVEDLPEVHPAGRVAMIVANMEFNWWLATCRIESRLKKIQAAKSAPEQIKIDSDRV